MDGVLAPGLPDYPRRLAEVGDRPKQLQMRGSWFEVALSVAVVGARAASGAALARAGEIAEAVAQAGGRVLSGGAIGVDAAAHRGALRAGGLTAAVMASGLDRLYPSQNQRLFAAIAERGALLSPFATGAPPRRFRFVRRNRVIAALADVVVIVEAERASGSLYTARAALEYGRCLAAVPGSPGCEALLAQGALEVETGAEVIAAARGQLVSPPRPTPPIGSDEALVYAALDAAPREFADLAAATGLDEIRVHRALVGLELSRLALPMPGSSYVRT
jgi:DNA processing protein